MGMNDQHMRRNLSRKKLTSPAACVVTDTCTLRESQAPSSAVDTAPDTSCHSAAADTAPSEACGVYADAKYAQVLTSVIGCSARVLLSSGKMFDGIMLSVSSLNDFALGLASPVHHADDGTVSARVDVTSVKEMQIFRRSQIVSVTVHDVDPDFGSLLAGVGSGAAASCLAASTDNAFSTDMEIAAKVSALSSKRPVDHTRQLQPWVCDDEEDAEIAARASTSLQLEDSRGVNGWDSRDMFDVNERVYGVQSDYTDALCGYTTVLEPGTRLACEQQACQKASEIEPPRVTARPGARQSAARRHTSVAHPVEPAVTAAAACSSSGSSKQAHKSSDTGDPVSVCSHTSAAHTCTATTAAAATVSTAPHCVSSPSPITTPTTGITSLLQVKSTVSRLNPHAKEFTPLSVQRNNTSLPAADSAAACVSRPPPSQPVSAASAVPAPYLPHSTPPDAAVLAQRRARGDTRTPHQSPEHMRQVVGAVTGHPLFVPPFPCDDFVPSVGPPLVPPPIQQSVGVHPVHQTTSAQQQQSVLVRMMYGSPPPGGSAVPHQGVYYHPSPVNGQMLGAQTHPLYVQPHFISSVQPQGTSTPAQYYTLQPVAVPHQSYYPSAQLPQPHVFPPALHSAQSSSQHYVHHSPLTANSAAYIHPGQTAPYPPPSQPTVISPTGYVCQPTHPLQFYAQPIHLVSTTAISNTNNSSYSPLSSSPHN